MYPWQHRAGHFSKTKAITLALVCLPGVMFIFALVLNQLGAEPVEELIHETGEFSLRLLLISLAVTPFRRIAGWAFLLPARRLIGVAAYTYLVAHFGLYWIDFAQGPIALMGEIASRLYLIIGFASLLLMSALAVTSFDAAIKRLGGHRWRQVHMLTYPITVLALIHFTLHAKIDISEPMVLWALFAWMMGFRLIDRDQSRRPPILHLAGLTLAVTLLVIGAEILWYWSATGVPPSLILEANLTLDTGLRPMWSVPIAGTIMILLALFRPKRKRRATAA